MDGKLIEGVAPEGLKVEFDASAKRVLTVDVQRYQQYLDDTDMSGAEKAEFLQALWQIIVSFVELGYGVHPLQEVCGKDAGISTESADEALDEVVSKEPRKENEAHGASPAGNLELE